MAVQLGQDGAVLEHQHCLLALPRVLEVVEAHRLVDGYWSLFLVQDLLEEAVVFVLRRVHQSRMRLLVLERACHVIHALAHWVGAAFAAVHPAVE